MTWDQGGDSAPRGLDAFGPAEFGRHQPIAPLVAPVAGTDSADAAVFAFVEQNSAEQNLADNTLAMWAAMAPLNLDQTGESEVIASGDGGVTYGRSTSDILNISGQAHQAETIDTGADSSSSAAGVSDGLAGTYSHNAQSYLSDTVHTLGLGLEGPFDVHAANADDARPVGQESDGSYGAAFDDVVLSGRFSAGPTAAHNGISVLAPVLGPTPDVQVPTAVPDWAGSYVGHGASLAFDSTSVSDSVASASDSVASGPPSAAVFAGVSSLATYLVSGYWAYANYDGNQPRHWASTTISVNISALTTAEQNLAINALNMWASVAPLSFTYTTGSANITYNHNGGATQYVANTSDTTPVSGQNYQAETIDIST